MLQLPLRPTVAANLLMQIVLRQLGGKGSGNFGHEGRPGERGGSGNTLTNVRIRSGVSIAHTKRPGTRIESDQGWMTLLVSNDPLGQEVFIGDVEVKENLRGQGYGRALYEQALEYALSRGAKGLTSTGALSTAAKKMWASFEAEGRVTEDENGARVLLPKGVRTLGGQGSGNFGHGGRPGEVGGSSDTDWFNVKKPSYPAGPKNEKGYSATFIGFMEALPGEEPIALFNVSGGPLSGSSVMQETLEREGIPLPPYPKLKSLGGKGSGNYGHSGRPGEKGGSSEGSGPTEKVRNARSLRALKAFIPIHAESQRYAEANELSVRRMVGGTRTEGNAPVDVEVVIDGRKKGIEVKTMVNNTNDKITMRKAAVEKKDLWGKRNHASVHTVVLDDRGKLGHKEYSGHRLYYRKGSGSFRLGSMTKVTSPQHLKELLSK